jgi:phenylalanyl-tRNA synthetase beta chain
MKISRNWLNKFIKSKKSDSDLVEAFTQLGLECTSERINSIDSNIVVGKIVSCISHPNADRLKVCEVDIDDNKLLTIVCGAPNVKDGILIPVAKVGSKVSDFEIKKTKIRDVLSQGMICSEKELGLSDKHDGIMVLDNNLEKGQTLTSALSLKSDSIFDFDITPNRGDCFSHLGISRELAIIEDSSFKLDKIKFKSAKFKTSDLVKLNVSDSKLCPRYSCRIIKNIKVQESPDWLKKALLLIGQKSINNIVDLANYIMFDTGQPLHTFDFDKLNGDIINIRKARNNEKILCLNNDLNELADDDIVISDSKGPIAIAGVIGGLDSQVDEKTKNILIESAVFDEISVRKTSKRYDYTKEASKRFERGIDYDNTVYAMDKFTKLILDISGGEASEDCLDTKTANRAAKLINFNINDCNEFLGINLDINEYQIIFKKLSINVNVDKDNIKCKIPSYRNDLDREIDLYEEVARVYGYNNIPISKIFNNSYSSVIDDCNSLNNKMKFMLSSKGFYEHYSNSLYSDKVLNDFNTFETSEIINESSLDMKYMRNSLMPGLLKAVSFNEKRGQNYFKLFELGRVHSKIKLYNKEQDNLGFVWYGQNNEHWNSKGSADIFYAKGELLSFLKQLNVIDVKYKVEESEMSEININVYSKNTCIGYMRILDSILKDKYDIKGPIVISEIYIDQIDKKIQKDFRYNKISTFPSVKRDISVMVKKEFKSGDIINCIHNSCDQLLIDSNIFDVYSGKELDKDSKSLAISLTFQSNEKTLVDKDVEERVSSILNNLKTKFDVIQR